MNIRKIIQLLFCIALPLGAGALSGYITAKGVNSEWFILLNRPSFNPPDELFAPVWTTLYAMMGISFFLILQTEKSEQRSNAILFFFIQLFLNFWWSVFFFSFKRTDIALGEMTLLWIGILVMIISFRKLKPIAAYLQIPYLLWVSFALVLNAFLWKLNQ